MRASLELPPPQNPTDSKARCVFAIALMVLLDPVVKTGLADESDAPPETTSGWKFDFGPDESWNLRLGAADGVVFEGPDGSPRVHAGGVLALQFLEYDSRNVRDSGARVDRAIARLDGALDSEQAVEFRLSVDLRGTDTRGLEEGWLSYEVPGRRLRFGAGMMKVPLGFEFSLQQEDLSFVGWSFPAYLTSRTDLVARVDGEFNEGAFYYDVVAAAGEGFDLFGQKNDRPQFSARVLTYPLRFADASLRFLHYEVPLLSGIFAGASVAYSPSFNAHLDVATPLRNKIFNTDTLKADGALFLHYTAGADMGPLRLAYELVNGSLIDVETPTGTESLRRQITAWQFSGTFLVTGEHYDSRPYRLRAGAPVQPRHPVWGVPIEDRGIGAIELGGRFSNADIDRDFFNFGLANFTESSQEFRVITGVLNWYAAANFKASFEVTRTIADQDPAAFGGGGRDTSYVLQLQYVF